MTTANKIKVNVSHFMFELERIHITLISAKISAAHAATFLRRPQVFDFTHNLVNVN